MRKIAMALASLLALVTLSACSVSAEEKASCQDSGGSVEHPDFEYKGTGFWGTKTGDLHVCMKDGQIMEVYNEEILDADPGFFHAGKKNYQVWKECTRREGRTYKTVRHAGKTSYTRYACVQGGRYVKILGD